MEIFKEARKSIFAQFNIPVKLCSDSKEKSITAYFRHMATNENIDGEYFSSTAHKLYLKTEDCKNINKNTIIKITTSKQVEEVFKVNESFHIEQPIMLNGTISVVVLEKINTKLKNTKNGI